MLSTRMNKHKLVEKYMVVMFKTRGLFHKLKGIPEKYSSMTMLQFQALHILFHNPEITVGKLAKLLLLSSASAAQLTDRMIIMKWIKRIRDKEDRRIIRLVITSKGKAELKTIRRKATDKMRQVFSMIPHGDLAELIRIQTDILSNLEKVANNE